jgi:hypothetical protein
MPDLDEMLRRAAATAAERAGPADFGELVRAARRRRAGRIGAAAAFGLVVCVLAGSAVVFGVRHDALPDPQPPAIERSPAVVESPGARPSPRVVLPPPFEGPVTVDASPPPLPPALKRYRDDPVLGPLVTTIPVIVWTPENGRTADDVQKGDTFGEAVFHPLPAGSQGYRGAADLRAVFPDAPAGGVTLLITHPAKLSQLAQSAANLRAVPGVRDARVVLVRGMWFTVTVRIPADESKGSPPGFGRARPMTLSGIVDGESGFVDPGKGKNVWYSRYTYLGPGVGRDAYDQICAAVIEPYRDGPETLTVKPLRITPE